MRVKNIILTLALPIAVTPMAVSQTAMPAHPLTLTAEHRSLATELDKLIADYEAVNLAHNPIKAGMQGDKSALTRLPDVSPENHAWYVSQIQTLYSRHQSIDASALPLSKRLDYDLLGFVFYQTLLLAPYDQARIPFTSDSGFFSNITTLPRQTEFKNQADYEAYFERLKGLPAYFDAHIENMQRGIETEFTAPKPVLIPLIQTLENLTAIAPEDHPLARPFTQMGKPSGFSHEQMQQLTQTGLQIMDSHVMPAYRKLLAFFEIDYLPKARNQISLSSTPNGKAHYEALVKYYTTLDLTPEQVHRIGQAEVNRIRKEMDKLISDIKFEGSFEDFIAFLREDPQFYAKSPEELLGAAHNIANRANQKMPSYFGRAAKLAYEIKAVPKELEQHYTTGRYFSGNLEQGKAGQFLVNTFDLSQRPLYNLPALTFHEAIPGHHHQISLAEEQRNVPTFRKNLYPHAFGEGWALYAEKLALEMGLYHTAYEKFGHLSYEMWRACRLIIDTGIHALGWSLDDAQKCLSENTALSKHNISTEMNRYIAWPGQALSYKIGELKILELRARSQKQLGEQFNIAAFHDAILVDGALPLKILDAKISGWSQQAAP